MIFAIHKDSEGEEVRICVDGKQRLTSIQKFFDGQVSLLTSMIWRTYLFFYNIQDTLYVRYMKAHRASQGLGQLTPSYTDKDPLTKKSYWYTRPESHKNTRLDIPADWKEIFASKQITCGAYITTYLQNLVLISTYIS